MNALIKILDGFLFGCGLFLAQLLFHYGQK
jgi:hypothetical protein